MSSGSHGEASSPSAHKVWDNSSQETKAEDAASRSLQQHSPPSDSPPGAEAVTTPQPPAWVMGLLSSQFFGHCDAHKHMKKNECTHFCTTCACGPGLCQHCLGHHQGHNILQIRRYVYCDVVRNQDINHYVNTDGIQSYIINQSKVVFLNARPQSKVGCTADPDTCAHCRRTLREGFRFCCLACKVEAGSKGLTLNLSRGRATPTQMVPAPLPQQPASRHSGLGSRSRAGAGAHRRAAVPAVPCVPSPAPVQAEAQPRVEAVQGLLPGLSPAPSWVGDQVSLLCGNGSEKGQQQGLRLSEEEAEAWLKGNGSNQSSSSEWRGKQVGAEGDWQQADGSRRHSEGDRKRPQTAETTREGCSLLFGDEDVQAASKRRRSTTTRSGRAVRPSSWVKGAVTSTTSLEHSTGALPSPRTWQAQPSTRLEAVEHHVKMGSHDGVYGMSKERVQDQQSLHLGEREGPLSKSHSSDLDESSFFQVAVDGSEGCLEGPAALRTRPASVSVGVQQQCLTRGIASSVRGRRKQEAPQRSHHV